MKTQIILTLEQEKVLKELVWFANADLEPGMQGFVTVGGLAGTGKTTILGELQRRLEGKRIAFCAFTGKAASVLAKKLDQFDFCGTIHSMIYRPIVDEKGKIIAWHRRAEIQEFDLIIVDEASMVGEEIAKDLLEYGVKIIFVGDHGQLPPVRSNFNLMQKPMLRLEKIHRQAEQNPIIRLSKVARESGAIEFGEFGEGVRKVKGMEALSGIELNDVMCLTGTNKMRQYINKLARQGMGERPEVGEKVICLKNNREKGIYNGMIGFVRACREIAGDKNYYQMQIEFEDDVLWEGRALKWQFGNADTKYDWRDSKGKPAEGLFDWAYALTVHKAQGSEAESVVLIEEMQPWLKPEDWKRWLYTAVTRAKKELLIIKP